MRCNIYYTRNNEKKVVKTTVEKFCKWASENENPAYAGFSEMFVVYEDGQMFSWLKGHGWQEWVQAANPLDALKVAVSFHKRL